MGKYRAEFRLVAEVEFEDDGQHSLQDLAFEAMEDSLNANHGFGIELIASSVRPIEDPTP